MKITSIDTSMTFVKSADLDQGTSSIVSLEVDLPFLLDQLKTELKDPATDPMFYKLLIIEMLNQDHE